MGVYYQHKVVTTYGTFSWQWHKTGSDTTKKGKKDWWIAGMFDKPEIAKQTYTCNPYSGKYNFHGLYNHKGYCVMSPLEQLMNFLEGLKEQNKLMIVPCKK